MSFKKSVFEIVKRIPSGKVSTYKQIARVLNRPNAYRAVGNALKKNSNFFEIPCHRVIKSNGEIGGYNRGIELKKRLLRSENVVMRGEKIDLDRFLVDIEELRD